MNILKHFSFLALLFIFNSCVVDEFKKEGDFFYLENEGATMPIWIKGNQSSNVFIIMLHGGPEGGSSQYYSIFPSHKRIEEQFAIAYWDQRMCGMSQGNPSMADATLEQFTEDLDKVLETINFKYNDPDIFLMGHSWGGALGTNYLLSHQDKVNGWIEIDGGHSWTAANALARTNTINYAEEKIADEDDTEFWEFALDWYDEHPVVGINEDAHYTFVGAANGYDFNPESDSLQVPFTDLLFFSPISTAYFFVPYQFSFLNKGLDLQNQLFKIKIPTLICWGKYDGVFPVEIAHDTFNKLGTPDENKYLHVFDFSAHSPNYEQPMEFAEQVIAFVNQYRR